MSCAAIEKYNIRVRKANSLVCVGLDADMAKIPERFLKKEFPQFFFNQWIIDQTHEYAAAYKLNSAFYEARGDEGMRELKMTLEYLQKNHSDIFTILDAKRADIGNTNHGYVESIFYWLGVDAVTVHPYLGREALLPFLDRKDKCTIVLAKTSNSGSPEFQDVIIGDTKEMLWQHIARQVTGVWNQHNNLMIVMGATYPHDVAWARQVCGNMTFLVPGVGAQGGDLQSVVASGKNSQGLGLIINSSRGIIFSENPGEGARQLRDQINEYR